MSRVSSAMVIVGLLIVAGSALVQRSTQSTRGVLRAISLIAVCIVACSALLFLLLRAQHDPPINQGNPNTWRALAYVVGREQYEVAGLWPRQAPIWLQLANWFEYADWQVALSLGPTVIPTLSRVLATIAFAALGLVGSVWHRRTDRRGWRAVGLLFVCGSLGVIAYLNFKAGRSFAWQLMPEDSRHEARDRDYFFVLGFWAWGIWAAMGAIALARRYALPVALGAVVAVLPIALNWSAVSRRSEPEASLPREVARVLLDGLPARSVLFVAGDNETYPVWYAQQVESRRRDVTVVTMPLLAAPWYVQEFARREQLPIATQALDIDVRAAALADAARTSGRPVAVALTVSARDRAQLARSWRVRGVLAVEDQPGALQPAGIAVDSAATRAAANAVALWRRGRTVRPSIDATNEYFQNVLECPALILAPRPSPAQLASLDSLCNLPRR